MTLSKRYQAKVRRRVKRGAKVLDKQRRGWAYRVRIKQLQIANPCKCILGQAFPPEAIRGPGNTIGMNGFLTGMRRLFGDCEPAVHHGFDWETMDHISLEFEQCELLEKLWAEEIRQRRGRSGTR